MSMTDKEFREAISKKIKSEMYDEYGIRKERSKLR